MNEIFDILKYLYQEMHSVSDNVYINIDPNFAPNGVDDYVVITANNVITQEGYRRVTYVRFSAFAKVDALQNENLPRLTEMETKIKSMFPIQCEGWQITQPITSMGGKVNAFSYVTINSTLIIF